MTNEKASGTLDGIGQKDHSATSEYRIFGPPGTGKTTSVARQISRAVDRYGPDSILITSFSRAAAAELAERDLPINPSRMGTLHSHCYHALNAPEIAESNVEDWNRQYPHLALTPKKKLAKLDGEETVEDESDLKKDGDKLLEDLSRYRGLMIPPQSWPSSVREFAAKWQEYKKALGLLDFSDLIDTCLRDVSIAPGLPTVIFADEAQDLNRMQLTLIRKWGERANYFILAGDDDQTIFSFTGASPDAILDPDIPEDHKIILKQSYRVPKAVHALASGLIHQVTRRQEKVYLPRPAEGEVLPPFDRRLQIAGVLHPQERRGASGSGQTVMFLTSCAYMLRPIVAVLRKNGIPFHNPYRKSDGFWNPLRVGRSGSSASRILALLTAHPDYGEGHRQWTFADLVLWAEALESKGILRRGVNKKLRSYEQTESVALGDLDQIFEESALESLLAAYGAGHRVLLAWWRERLIDTFRARVRFPADVVARGGPRALIETPKVIVGTIHSVKGGQADVVYLFPDQSQAGDAQYNRFGSPRDSVIRLFYVGATRARETLYICQRESARAVSI